MSRINPKVKDVLVLLGAGVFIAGSVLMPGLPVLVKPILDDERKRASVKELGKYNEWRLRYLLKRLYKEKIVDIVETEVGYEVKITEKGKKRLLRYNLETIHLNEENWDGKWRIVIYDVYESKKHARAMFRDTLRKLHFLQLQESVYLTPYECSSEIEFMRQLCDIGTEVVILTVNGLENEEVYKGYFDLSE